MLRKSHLVVLGLLIGCGGDGGGDATDDDPTPTDPGTTDDDTGQTTGTNTDDTGVDTGSTTSSPTSCTYTISGMWPEDGAVDVYYRTSIEVTVSDVDQGATLTVADASGTPVSGTTDWRGRTLVFTADDPLEPESTYDVTLDWCAGVDQWSWTTSEIGDPVTVGIAGRTYDIDLTTGRIVEPAGVGPLLQTQLDDTQFLASPAADNGTTLDWLLAMGDGTGAQDLCSETVSVSNADFTSDPYFSFGPATTTFDMAGVVVDIEDLVLSGAFSPDASSLDGVTLSGFIDTRQLVDLVVPGGADDAVCQLTASLGVMCEACDDGALLCLSLYADGLRGLEVPGVTLVERTQADIDADGACP